MTCLYNENDPFAAAWLRNLTAAELIAPGVVDERSIADLQPGDLADYKQAHFFAGIGGWPYALRLAGWPDDRPVWTGSCPCQPFSSAGKGEGFDDPRHLWPAWFRLICECRPAVVFGEQVASPAGLGWFDHVSTDLEAEGYAVGAADLCAAGVGAPHIRQRLFFVANASIGTGKRNIRGVRGAQAEIGSQDGTQHGNLPFGPQHGGAIDGLVHAESRGLGIDGGAPRGAGHESEQAGRLGNAEGGDGGLPVPERGPRKDQPESDRPGSASPWSDLVWLPCRDGKARPAQPGIFPLAHGIPNRVGTLRGAGNAIVAPLAAEFVRAYMESGA